MQATAPLAGRSVMAGRSRIKRFLFQFQNISLIFPKKIMAGKFPEFFRRKFSGKSLLFYRKFPEKFRRKFHNSQPYFITSVISNF